MHEFPHFSADQQSTIDLQFSLPTTIILATAILFSFVMSVIGNSLSCDLHHSQTTVYENINQLSNTEFGCL